MYLLTIKGQQPELLTAEQLRLKAVLCNLTFYGAYVLYEIAENGIAKFRRANSWGGDGVPWCDITDTFGLKLCTLKPEESKEPEGD